MRRDGASGAALYGWALETPRSAVVPAQDTIVAELPLFVAFVLRNGNEPPPSSMPALRYGMPLFILTGGLSFSAFNLSRGTCSYTSAADLTAIVAATTCATCLYHLRDVPPHFLVDRAAGVPRTVPAIQWFILVVLLSRLRLVYRFYRFATARERHHRVAATGDRIYRRRIVL
jgi:FlaA1/EpsC-like NDP-sugar epimerase